MLIHRPHSELYYEISGADFDEAPTLVFANSLGTNLSLWDTMVEEFRDFRLIRYDKPGHGRSEFISPFGMQDLVSDAIALIETTSTAPVIFIGVSIGGMIGQGVCAERPDLVSGFVLMDSAAKIGTEVFWNERIESIRQNGLASLSAPLMERWFTKDFIAQGHAEKWRAMVESTDPRGYISCCEAIAHTDLIASTARLQTPTLALAGSEDGSTPPDLVRETAESITGSNFKIIRKAGHLPCVEQPETTAHHIREFIEGLK